jgi:hypothetical protein
MTKGYCDDAEKCENAGTHCDICTRSWFYEEPADYFLEKDEEEVEEL